jgi:hypothetical protein
MEGASLRQIYQDRNMPARSIAITPRRLADIADVLTESELAAAERQLQAGADVCFRLKVLPNLLAPGVKVSRRG